MARGGFLSPLSGPDRPTLPRESICLQPGPKNAQWIQRQFPAVLALATDRPKFYASTGFRPWLAPNRLDKNVSLSAKVLDNL